MMVAGVTYQLTQETRIPKTRDRIEMKIMEGKLSKRISIQMRWNFRAGYFIFLSWAVCLELFETRARQREL